VRKKLLKSNDMELFDETKFETKKELFKFLHDKQSSLIAQKKAKLKHADSVWFQLKDKEGNALKANAAFEPGDDSLKVKVVINTTNLLDSHGDVHMKGIWTKSLKENKALMHLQEHVMAFDKIIADGNELKAYTEDYDWNEIGFDYDGSTQALIFESTIKEDGKEPRNKFMTDQYSKGRVKNHSVGMQYVKLLLAVNDEEYGAEYEAWEKYFPEVANKEAAEEKGYMWIVKEAKVVEGSAVPIGSNWVTPTLDNNAKNEPILNHSEENNEPDDSTQKIDYEYLTKEIKKIKNLKN